MSSRDVSRRATAPFLLTHAAISSAVWLMLTGGALESWACGVPAVLVASFMAALVPRAESSRFRLLQLPRFGCFFLWHSIRGGVDVAHRALQPRMNISPGFYSYRVQLRRESARVLFANTINLLPGTLSAEMQGQSLIVHALNVGETVTDELWKLEAIVAALFDEEFAATEKRVKREEVDE